MNRIERQMDQVSHVQSVLTSVAQGIDSEGKDDVLKNENSRSVKICYTTYQFITFLIIAIIILLVLFINFLTGEQTGTITLLKDITRLVDIYMTSKNFSQN